MMGGDLEIHLCAVFIGVVFLSDPLSKLCDFLDVV